MDEESNESLKSYKKQNKQQIQKRLNENYQSKTDINLLNFKDQFNINDNYSINKNDFKKTLYPKLFDLMSNESNSKAQASALLLLQIILFHDWKLGKSELTESALNASLIPKLISINETTNETEIQELVSSFYLLLCFVIADDNKNVKKLLLSTDNLLVDPTIRILENSNNESLIKDSLILFQFYIYCAKEFRTISPVLSPLTRFLKHGDQTVISQSLYTLLVFSHSFREARIVLMDSKIGKNLLGLWTDSENDENIIKPIFAIIKSLLPRFNDYKNQFLSTELNILEIIPKLFNSSLESNRIYANEIIKMLAMKPISAKHYSPTEQINTIIKYKVIESVNKLLQFDNSFSVKSSALNAIFVIAFNSSLDQLQLLAEQGCLKALCSQLDTDDQNHLKVTVLSISLFLIEEFKDILKNKYEFVKPKESLTHFATIIEECDGRQQLSRLNSERVQRERLFNKDMPDWRHKKEGYKLSDTERMIEEIMILSFGEDDTRPKRRQPSNDVMAKRQALISCCDCKNAVANTQIFSCEHVSYCQKCASSAVHKVYSGDPKKCSVDKCEKPIPVMDCPYYLFKSKLYKEYLTQQTKLEHEIEPEVHK